MTSRQKAYQDILAACRNQTTGWLERCAAEPDPHQNRISRLAVRNALRERKPAYVMVRTETAYGSPFSISDSVRVF